MLGLSVQNIHMVANTNGGRFSVDIPLYPGLNIIRAENSTGKSTCVNAIAYGLGLEAILGPSRKRPFPKSLYEVIFDNKKEENPYFVSSSFVSIAISNSKGRSAIVIRDILGDDNKVTVEENSGSIDYFLGVSGKIGSAKSERGFHHWLAQFLEWKLPKVVTYEAKETLLYLECIFPLFFIEQKRGWSEIQANIPSNYGIKNVKKAAVEFCLAIDSFEHEKKVAKYKNKIEDAEKEWDQLRSSAEGVADFNSLILSRIPAVKDFKDSFNVEFMFQEGNATVSVSEQERTLKKLIETLSNDISAATPDNDKLDTQLAILRKIRRGSEKNSEDTEITMFSLNEVENKLLKLYHDLDQYQQLKKLKAVGSNIEADLDTKTCPICESILYDTLGNRSVKREPMTLEENIDFLKNQIDFYKNIKLKNVGALQDLQVKGKLISSRIEREQQVLYSLREDINDINGEMKAILRSKINAEIELKEVIKLKAILNDLKDQASRIHSVWDGAIQSLKTLRRKSTVDDRSLVLRALQSYIKGNLEIFNFTPSAIDTITISPQSLRPEQEGYDIVAETSASDYIRIIWSYTLALMQLAGKKEEIINGGFIVFDEPRQHEASKFSFANLISKASESSSYNGQVIFATSLDEKELRTACSDKKVNLICFEDYILSLEPEPEPEPEPDSLTASVEK